MTTATATRAKAPVASGLTIDTLLVQYATSLKARNRSDETVSLYMSELRKLSRWLAEQGMPTDVGLIRREHIEAHLVAMQQRGNSEATVSLRFRSIRPFWKWLVEEDEIDVSPMERMAPPSVHVADKPFPAIAQMEALLDTCKGRSFEDRRDRAIILLLYDTGIRRGELCNLRLADVDVASGRLRVIGKARVPREVNLNPVVAQAIHRYLRVRAAHTRSHLPALWLGTKGELGGSGVLQLFRRRGRLLNPPIPSLHPHALRHAFAHNALSDGMQESDVMRTAGWKTASMLRRYGSAMAAERALESHAKHSAAAKLRLR